MTRNEQVQSLDQVIRVLLGLIRRSLRFGGACFIASALWLAGAPEASAQQGFDPARFCYLYGGTTTFVCSDTRQEAEIAMRNDPAFQGTGQFLERFDPPGAFQVNGSMTVPNVQFYYQIQKQAPLARYTMYATTVPGVVGCIPPAQDPNADYASWCDSETNLIALTQQRLLATEFVGCTITGTVIADDNAAIYDQGVIEPDPNNPQRGLIKLGVGYDQQYRRYDSTAQCPGQSPEIKSHSWYVRRHTTFICRSGFKPVASSTINGGADCETQAAAYVALINGPLQQCASCPASPNPVYPATGEKARMESDFVFAGRSFKRHYHSLGQFKASSAFAASWTHTYSDRLHAVTGLQSASLVNDEGYFESFVRLPNSPNRYRGENSTDRILESLTSGNVSWRLRLAGGELRDFDADGRLISIQHPADPLNAVTLTYSGNLLSLVTDKKGRSLRFEYSDGMLSRIVQPSGAAVVYGYDTDKNLTSVDYGNSQVKQYHYHEAGLADAKFVHHLTGITSETGQRFASFKYDARGRVIESRVLGMPNNEVTTVTYDSDTQATVRTASNGDRVYTITPGLYRRVTSVQNAGEAISAMQFFDTKGRRDSSKDRRNVTTKYEYDTSEAYRSAVVEAFNTPEQRREEVTRDPTTNLVTERRTYDNLGALKAKTAWAYNVDNQVTTVTATDPADNAVRETSTAYCDATDVANSTCPFVGLVKEVNGPRPEVVNVFKDIARYTYRQADESTCAASPTTCPYRKGDVWKITNAMDQVVEIIAYDGAGRTKSIKDANGVITDFEYNNFRGWLLKTKVRGTDSGTEADDRITTIDYFADGSVQRVTQPDGVYVTFGYDAAHRLTSIADNDGNTITYTLNGAGARVQEDTRDATATPRRTLSRTYNTLGQLQALHLNNPDPSMTTPVTTSFQYDLDGNLDITTDALLRQTDNDYDPLGRLKRTLQNATGAVGDMDRAETAFRYDALDRLTKVIDPKNLETNYFYNGFGDQMQLVSPDTGTTDYDYDKAGNRTLQTDANGKISNYAYDGLNRITTVTYPQETALNETYVYDVAQSDCIAGETFLIGRLSRMSDGSGNTTYCYNRFGDLTRKVQRTNNKTFTIRWQYAANGRLQTMHYPDGTALNYEYDSQGRIAEINVQGENGGPQQLLRNVSYAPFGPVQRWTYGNGLEYRRTLNKNYQPGVVEDGPENGASLGISLGYQFDPVGNLVTLRDGKQLQTLRTYQYDDLNRLKEARNGSNVLQQQYGYDKTGNRLSSGESIDEVALVCDGEPYLPGSECFGGVSTVVSTNWITRDYAYATGSHRLSSVDGVSRTHDAAGNLTSIAGGQSYIYSAANRMKSATGASYAYSAGGERVLKSAGSSDTYSVHDASGRWIGDYDANGTPIQQAVWLGDLPVGVLRMEADTFNKLYYVEPDALGTPRVVINPSYGSQGVVVWRWDLAGAPFGNHTPESGGFVFDMRFPGQRYDSVSGLNYNMRRDYEPGIGRYVQSDPIGLYGGISAYGYVDANPFVGVDFFGLSSSPGLGDQINPMGIRGSGVRHYSEYFERRFPRTISGATAEFERRIIKRVCNNVAGQPTELPGLNTGVDDIDIQPDMSRFGDAPQSFYERRVVIGRFEIKTDKIGVNWDFLSNQCSSCFFYRAHMYISENTGDNSIPGFVERNVRMGSWVLSGRACCGQ